MVFKIFMFSLVVTLASTVIIDMYEGKRESLFGKLGIGIFCVALLAFLGSLLALICGTPF